MHNYSPRDFGEVQYQSIKEEKILDLNTALLNQTLVF